MKVLLDINESKALFFMELLNNFSFIKVHSINNETTTALDSKYFNTRVINNVQEKKVKNTLFEESFGMWAGRNDIDPKKIRKESYERRTKNYDNATL